MPGPTKKRNPVVVYLDNADYDTMVQLAEKHSMSLSQVGRLILAGWLQGPGPKLWPLANS